MTTERKSIKVEPWRYQRNNIPGKSMYGPPRQPDPNEAELSEHPVSICNGKGGLPLSAEQGELIADLIDHAPRSAAEHALLVQFCNVLRGHEPSGPPRWHLHGEAGRAP